MERGRPPSPALRRDLRHGLVGGAIVSDTGTAPTRALTGALRASARAGERPAPLVMVDQEGGRVRRIADAPPSASAAHLGQGGPRDTARTARATGCALRRRGVTLDLAPVADAATLPTGFIATAERAFGPSARVAAPHVAAFVTGLHRGGVGATLKHFPGLGATAVSTDASVRATATFPGRSPRSAAASPPAPTP